MAANKTLSTPVSTERNSPTRNFISEVLFKRELEVEIVWSRNKHAYENENLKGGTQGSTMLGQKTRDETKIYL